MTDKPSSEIYRKILRNIESVIVGQSAVIRQVLAVFVSGGHVLLEDYPGTGKTTLAKTLSKSTDAAFKRIQFTPDLLPSDILGISVYDQKEGRFHFHRGPVFTNILLADEINRASPRTQSALLEAMGESQVSIEGRRYVLEDLFFVIATQNPVESRGTYPLPEAQMDRFTARLSMGYVPPEREVDILSGHGAGLYNSDVEPCVSVPEIIELKKRAARVRISDELKRYIVDIVRATRQSPGVELGASPRASLSLMKTAQALALFDGLEFVTPEQIQEMAVTVISHRLSMAPDARFSGETAEDSVRRILEETPVPV